MSRSFAQRKAIENSYRKKLLKLNPKLNDNSGIYFWTRIDENDIKHCYVGQARHILQRNIQHMISYQRVDLSIKKHGLYDEEENPYGYKLDFLIFPRNELDEKERHYITLYAKNGYQMKNIDTGGGAGKQELGERKPSKGYRDGLDQGRKNASKEMAHLFDLHLDVTTKKNPPTVNQQKALEKFQDFLDFHKGSDEE